MSTTIKWDKSNLGVKRAVVELLGWVTSQGKLTKTGERIARSAWGELTPAAQNVLKRAGVTV